MPCIGIPKTIDNDLEGMDVTCGFDSAVETVTHASDSLHATAEAHARVMLLEVMGRHAGFIALHAGLAGGADVIWIPELPYHLESVIAKIRQRESLGMRFSIVVVAEGAKPHDGDVPPRHGPLLQGVGACDCLVAPSPSPRPFSSCSDAKRTSPCSRRPHFRHVRSEVSVLRDAMRGHDTRGNAMRDAIARADLHAAKKEAHALAQGPFDVNVERAWQANVISTKAALSRVAQANELAEGSRGLAAVARSCGDCHTALDVRSFILSSPPVGVCGSAIGCIGISGRPRASGTDWSLHRTICGTPLRTCFKTRHSNPERFAPGRSPDPAIGELAAYVHTLGKKAAVTRARAGREAIYAELLTTCAACHVRLGGGP